MTMQGYNELFARVYNRHWTEFARHAAPRLILFYAQTRSGAQRRPVLDLCCGTGQLAAMFLEHGFPVTGLDLSDHMLRHARENAAAYLADGQARFIQANACDFRLDEPVALTISTYDALNHLDNDDELRRCFQCVAAVTEDMFLFDLNTRLGLQRWNGLMLNDSEEIFLMSKGIYEPGMSKAWTSVSGFLRTASGLYERFEQTVSNTAFEMARVAALLADAGWKSVYCARLDDLRTPLPDPEAEPRVWFVARKHSCSATEDCECSCKV
jgi:SAM-dependent methyltransferase